MAAVLLPPEMAILSTSTLVSTKLQHSWCPRFAALLATKCSNFFATEL